MTLADWIRNRLRDDAAHAEIDRREKVVEELTAELRAEREKNGFGHLFATALRPTWPTVPPPPLPPRTRETR